MIVGLGVVFRPIGAEKKVPSIGTFFHKRSKVWKLSHIHGVPVVEPGAFHQFIGQLEAERFNEIEHRARCGAQPGNVAGVLRNIGLNEDDIKGIIGPVEWNFCSGSGVHKRVV